MNLIVKRNVKIEAKEGSEMICKFCGSGEVSMFFEEIKEKLSSKVRITKECDYCGEKWV